MKISYAKPNSAPMQPPPRRAPETVLGVTSGASPAGSTFYRRLRVCAREHALATIARFGRDGDNEALTVGFLIHFGLEHYYRKWMAEPDVLHSERERAAFAALAPIAEEPGYAATWTIVSRVLDAYFAQYRLQDNWKILAVEETLVSSRPFPYSARLDLVIQDLSDGGMWIVEHKSTRAMTENMLEGYQIDPQILGQYWLMEQCADLSKLPPFRGVRVNIMTKAAAPRFARPEVCPSPAHIAAWQKQLEFVNKRLLPLYEHFDWPQDFTKCSGVGRGFRQCDYFNICYGQPTMPFAELVSSDPPFGYVVRPPTDADEVE